MANVHPYLAFNNTKEALSYYEEVFGVTNVSRMPVSAEQAEQFGVSKEQAADMTMHSQFSVLGATIMAADNFQQVELNYDAVSILLDLNSEDEEAMKEADVFWALVEKSDTVKVNMPFEEQFWGGKMGDFTDKYGVRWLLHAQPYSKIAEMLNADK
ncbi:MAG: glyoxalase/bleomycin resistance/extradiol dioxygenase family protein [Streptococcaceae bacterium]|nr:glyoxalase/bleomycin resistance/extradiol dioxygenase family protein [Streptococcaceae bacterium]